jgi:hypothetical protein
VAFVGTGAQQLGEGDLVGGGGVHVLGVATRRHGNHEALGQEQAAEAQAGRERLARRPAVDARTLVPTAAVSCTSRAPASS